MIGAPLVLGVGNSILGDDGVGVHVVRALDGCGALPEGTEVVDGGTGGLSLLPLLVDATSLVLVDAVDVGAAPGTVHVLYGEDLYGGLVRLSVHQVGAADLVAAARLTGQLPDGVVLVGVQPECLSPGARLSPAVTAAVPKAVRAVVTWCHRLTAGMPITG